MTAIVTRVFLWQTEALRPGDTLLTATIRVIGVLAIALALCVQAIAAPDWKPIEANVRDARLQGAWEDASTGHVVVFSDGRIDVFHRLDAFWIRDTGVVPAFALYAFDADTLLLQHYDYRAHPELLQAPKVLRRATPVPAAVMAQTAAGTLPPGEVFDLIWRTFDRYYAFFNERGVDWAAARRTFDPRAQAAANDDALFDVLSEMLRPLQDGHVNLSHGERRFNAGRSQLRERLKQAWARSGSALTEQAFVSDWHKRVSTSVYEVLDEGSLRSGAAGALEWGTIGDAGYVRVNRFAGFSETEATAPRPVQDEALRQALRAMDADLARTTRIIVDVALNGGGSDTAAMTVASHFADAPRLVLEYGATGAPRQRVALGPAGAPWRRPILLLTSEVTASAAESFVLMMRAYPHVTQVGERTRGILSSLLPKPFPNGFMATIAYQHVLDADGKAFEARGIPPARAIELFPDDDLTGGFARAVRELARE